MKVVLVLLILVLVIYFIYLKKQKNKKDVKNFFENLLTTTFSFVAGIILAIVVYQEQQLETDNATRNKQILLLKYEIQNSLPQLVDRTNDFSIIINDTSYCTQVRYFSGEVFRNSLSSGLFDPSVNIHLSKIISSGEMVNLLNNKFIDIKNPYNNREANILLIDNLERQRGLIIKSMLMLSKLLNLKNTNSIYDLSIVQNYIHEQSRLFAEIKNKAKYHKGYYYVGSELERLIQESTLNDSCKYILEELSNFNQDYISFKPFRINKNKELNDSVLVEQLNKIILLQDIVKVNYERLMIPIN